MTVLNESLLLAADAGGGGGGYQIERSLRFNSADSAYLSRTPASAGNRKTFTISLWVKRCKLGVLQAFTSSSNNTILLFDANNKLNFYLGAYVRTSTQVFRDTSAWYHIVLAVDTTNATAQNRVRMFVNNSEITTWDTNTTVTQNADTTWNDALAHQIGANDTSQFTDQYIADFHNIDGQALDPTSFGEFDTNGVWQPIEYTGTYGTNGFHLPFSNNSTAAALGTDTSGNSNTWTVNNLSVTAGSDNDSLVDTPTSYGTDTGAGGEVRGNYCTWNPLAKTFVGTITFSNGNLDIAESSGAYATIPGTIAISSGKYYWEVTRTASSSASDDCAVGITLASATGTSTIYGPNNYVYRATGQKTLAGGGYVTYGASWTTGDVIGVAVDLTASTLTFYKNGVSQGAATTSLPAGVSFLPCCGDDTSGTQMSWTANFGQRPFAYTAPSGFKALCTTNLPDPVVAQPSTVMDVKLYTGNDSTQTISGLGFSPDLVWLKARATVGVKNRPHQLFDTVRGAPKALSTNRTDAEDASGGYDNDGALTAFTSDGFTVEAGPAVNSSSSPYVGWAWDAGSSTVTNTDGSITSQVRANASAGFSIVTWNGVSSVATIGHGLGVAPQFYIVFTRAGGNNHGVYHASLGNFIGLQLNNTAASYTDSRWWNNTSPTSTVFSVSDFANVTGSGMIAYCFAPVEGYSAFGSYTGNGSTDGPFVYTGFRPRWIMIKGSSFSGSHWLLFDAARSAYNLSDDQLYANLSNSEETGNSALDLLANGFKCRADSFSNINASGATYIYAAFAEHPFKTARAR